MPQVPYVESNGHFTAIVELKNASNVFMVDESNFRKYRSGQPFKYYGGYYDQTPVRISVNGIGRYYLVVENSDYSYRFV